MPIHSCLPRLATSSCAPPVQRGFSGPDELDGWVANAIAVPGTYDGPGKPFRRRQPLPGSRVLHKDPRPWFPQYSSAPDPLAQVCRISHFPHAPTALTPQEAP